MIEEEPGSSVFRWIPRVACGRLLPICGRNASLYPACAFGAEQSSKSERLQMHVRLAFMLARSSSGSKLQCTVFSEERTPAGSSRRPKNSRVRVKAEAFEKHRVDQRKSRRKRNG